MAVTILNPLNLLRTFSCRMFQQMHSYPSARLMHSLYSNSNVNTNSLLSGHSTSTSICLIPIRTNIRCHFPRPNERMRIKKHGYKKRLSTQTGLRVLLRRILKGRHNISH